MPEEETGTEETGTEETGTETEAAGTENDGTKGGDGKTDAAVGDAGRKAIAAMKRERNAALQRAADFEKKNKEYEDANKSESERLSEAAETARSRADKAELSYKRLQTAMTRAPEHATLKHVMAVAKRLAGDSDEEMEADADELFDLLAPAKAEEEKRRPAGKPRESLKGGGDPEEEPEETDPRKLAELIGRP